MLTLKIENKNVENSFNTFNKNSLENLDDLSHLGDAVKDGLNSPLSTMSHEEIFK